MKPKVTLGLHSDDPIEMAVNAFSLNFRNPKLPLVTMRDQFIIDGISLNDLTLKLQAKHPHCCMFSHGDHQSCLTTQPKGFKEGDIPLFIGLYRDDGRSMDVLKAVVTVTIVSVPAVAQEIFSFFEAQYSMNRKASIDWYYKSERGTNHVSMTLEAPPPVFDEFYPYIQNPRQYLQGYLESTSTILFMSGPPGTGKTSLLRSIIYEHSIHTAVAYDHRILEEDEFFMAFLQARGADLVVMEDSEEFLRKRENDNLLIAKFLNVSDGLVKPRNKKIIFTTNFKDFKDIDTALTRPGRCFGFLTFRPLSYDEAAAACGAAKLPIPVEQKEYTLAELFNQDTKPHTLRKAGY